MHWHNLLRFILHIPLWHRRRSLVHWINTDLPRNPNPLILLWIYNPHILIISPYYSTTYSYTGGGRFTVANKPTNLSIFGMWENARVQMGKSMQWHKKPANSAQTAPEIRSEPESLVFELVSLRTAPCHLSLMCEYPGVPHLTVLQETLNTMTVGSSPFQRREITNKCCPGKWCPIPAIDLKNI